MASRNCASVAMLLLMFLCVGSAHRLFLEPIDRIAASAGHTEHIEPSPGRKRDSTGVLFEKPASEPWGVLVSRGEDQTNQPEDLDLDLDLDRPAEKEKQDGVEAWDLDRPTEKEKLDGEPLLSNSANGFQDVDDFSGDLANIYPELNYLN